MITPSMTNRIVTCADGIMNVDESICGIFFSLTRAPFGIGHRGQREWWWHDSLI
jgi:hypothetical protein